MRFNKATKMVKTPAIQFESSLNLVAIHCCKAKQWSNNQSGFCPLATDKYQACRCWSWWPRPTICLGEKKGLLRFLNWTPSISKSIRWLSSVKSQNCLLQLLLILSENLFVLWALEVQQSHKTSHKSEHGSQRQIKISRLALLSLPWTRTRTASSRRRTSSAAFPASVKLRLFPIFKGKNQPSSRLMRASRSLTKTKTGCSTLSSSRTSWGSGSLCQTRWICKKHWIVSTGYNCWLLICNVDCWPLNITGVGSLHLHLVPQVS